MELLLGGSAANINGVIGTTYSGGNGGSASGAAGGTGGGTIIVACSNFRW